MVQPTAQAQYLLELINEARLNPNTEASRLGIDLNEGLKPEQHIDSDPKQPLAFNSSLIDSAHDHSQWMLETDSFSYTGVAGSTPGERMEDAGYNFTGTYRWNESIAWSQTTVTSDMTQEVYKQHESLFVDSNSLGRGHRINLMNEDFREIGIGIETGTFTSGGTDFNAIMTTLDFAKSGSESFLTGVAYSDQDNNDFYTPGEGLGGVTVQAVRAEDGETFTTETMDAGGYQIQLAPGDYTVTFSGGSLDDSISETVAIADQNVKVDAIDRNPLTPQNQTPGNDDLIGTDGLDNLIGSNENDRILGNNGNDILVGAGGDDLLSGGEGRDLLRGGPGSDTFVLATDTAADRLNDADRIFDFQVGIDSIGLTGGLTEDSLELTSIGNHTAIGINYSNQFLGIVVGVTHDQLNGSFVSL